MKIALTKISGIVVVELEPIKDSRGSFKRLFCEQELRSVIDTRSIVQINHSSTASVGSIRGLHYQNPPHAEMKLVQCLEGCVWDVAVDLRADSPTFLQWHAEELSPANCKMLVIPEGCAHGFQTLEPNSELLYFHTALYNKFAEGGVRYNDPRLNIAWPLNVGEISERDQNHPLILDNYMGIEL